MPVLSRFVKVRLGADGHRALERKRFPDG